MLETAQRTKFKMTKSLQSVEFRLRKLEDVAEQTMNHLAVIHRFMATHPSLVNRGSTDTLGPPPPTFQAGASRLRTASDRSEVSNINNVMKEKLC